MSARAKLGGNRPGSASVATHNNAGDFDGWYINALQTTRGREHPKMADPKGRDQVYGRNVGFDNRAIAKQLTPSAALEYRTGI